MGLSVGPYLGNPFVSLILIYPLKPMAHALGPFQEVIPCTYIPSKANGPCFRALSRSQVTISRNHVTTLRTAEGLINHKPETQTLNPKPSFQIVFKPYSIRGQWSFFVGNGHYSWAMVKTRHGHFFVGNGQNSRAMVTTRGQWSKLAGNGENSWAMVKTRGQWSKLMGNGQNSWAMVTGKWSPPTAANGHGKWSNPPPPKWSREMVNPPSP